MRSNKGFTLIELMIVVAIIAIIAAIAIPNLLRARLASNEASAIGALRTLSSSQASFQAAQGLDADNDGTGEYASLVLMTNATPPYIDEVLGSNTKSGYRYQITTSGTVNTNEVMWEATAYPVNYQRSGNRTFYVDESGVVRGSDNTAGTLVLRAVAAPPAANPYPPIGS